VFGLEAATISIALIAGFSAPATWPKSMVRVESLETTNDFITPLFAPTSA